MFNFGENVVINQQKCPSYIKALLKDDLPVNLIYNKIGKVQLENIDSPMVKKETRLFEMVKDVSCDLELTGNPLEIDLETGMDNTLIESSTKRLPNWSKDETNHFPFTINEARDLLNKILSKNGVKTETEEKNRPYFCVVNGDDLERTIIIGMNKTTSTIERVILRLPKNYPQCYGTEMFQYAKKSHSVYFKNKEHIQTKISSLKTYKIHGFHLQNCPSILSTDYNGSVAIEAVWEDHIYECEQLSRQANLKVALQIILGHSTSPINNLWEQLLDVQKHIQKSSHYIEEKIHDESIDFQSYSVDDIVNLLNFANYRKDKKIQTLDLKNIRHESFLDKFWYILKRCRSLLELRDCFHDLFESLIDSKSKVRVPDEDNSLLGGIIKDILTGNCVIPTLTFRYSLELMIDLGLEKLKNDYMAIIRFFYYQGENEITSKWSKLCEYFKQEPTEKRNTIYNKLSLVDNSRTLHKYCYVLHLHLISEFMLISKNYLLLSKESFSQLYENVFKTFSFKFDNLQKPEDYEKELLYEINCSISSDNISITSQVPESWLLTIKSIEPESNDSVTSVFLMSEYKLIPENIFDNYGFSEESNSAYYLTNLVKFVNHIRLP